MINDSNFVFVANPKNYQRKQGGNDDYMKALRKRNRRCYNLFWNCLKHPVVYVAVVLFYFFFAMNPVTTSNC